VARAPWPCRAPRGRARAAFCDFTLDSFSTIETGALLVCLGGWLVLKTGLCYTIICATGSNLVQLTKAKVAFTRRQSA